jgi:predicted ATP-binding protein involved in virulence
MTINGKIKVIDKDISDFSVDRTRKKREIKIDMTNNLLIEETLDEFKGMEIDKSTFYKSYKALPLAIYIEIERLSVSKSALYKSLCAKARIVAESFHRSIK